MIGIVENSPGLARYFERFLAARGVPCVTWPAWDGDLPTPDAADAWILTGDYANISDGLLPRHQRLVAFLEAVADRRVFGSCFSHQLMAHATGGEVRRRAERFFGFQPMTIVESHPVFAGVSDPHFLSLNGDEVAVLGLNARLLARAPGCEVQAVGYGPCVVTVQSHPEILLADMGALLESQGAGLRDRCPDLEAQFARTRGQADDASSHRFMGNLIDWLLDI